MSTTVPLTSTTRNKLPPSERFIEGVAVAHPLVVRLRQRAGPGGEARTVGGEADTPDIAPAATAAWQIAYRLARTLQLLALMAVAVAPVAEETLFRGILYPAIKAAGYPRLALWGTSILFGASHVNLVTFLPLTFLALALTWLYEKTDNLTAPILAHSLFNTANFFQLVIERQALACEDGNTERCERSLVTAAGIFATGTGLPQGATVITLAAGRTTLFAGVYRAGVYRSDDLGRTWIAIHDGLSDPAVGALVVGGSNLYAGTSLGGVWRLPL